MELDPESRAAVFIGLERTMEAVLGHLSPEERRRRRVAGLRQQVAERGFMNLVWQSTTVELFVPVVPLQHEILRRAKPLPFAGRTIRVTTAEDLILLKMAFHRHKDIQDIRGILHVQGGRLDLRDVRHWSGQMLEDRVAEESEALLAAAGGRDSAGDGSRREPS